jgi:hypothetical protein
LEVLKDDLEKNKKRNPKEYFKILKSACGLKKKEDILEPGKVMYDKE